MATNVVVPQLGESVVEARVARWLKKPGDAVSAGEPLVELETEKIDLEVGAEQAGVLAEIKRQEGEDVKVGELLAIIDARAVPASDSPPAESQPPPAESTAAPTASAEAAPAGDGQKGRATPTARKVAEKNAVDLARVAASGEAGRVVKKDVETFLSSEPAPPAARPAASPAVVARPAPAAPSPAAEPGARAEERQRLSKRRLTIARNLVEAQQTAAMLTTFNEVDMTGLMSLRDRHKEGFKKRHGVGLGIASFFVKASVGALKAFPRLNASERAGRFGQKPATVLITGLAGAGKSTTAYALERKLFDMGRAVSVLDGRSIRRGISRDLGFSVSDRSENLRRGAEAAKLLNDAGLICLAAFLAPEESVRQKAADVVGRDKFLVVHLDAPLEVCRQRDQSGMYEKADEGELANVPGVSAAYEPPAKPDLVLDTAKFPVDYCVAQIVKLLADRGVAKA